LFPHLHNALSTNVTAGIPLSPEHYARCFDLPEQLFFDEAKILQRIADAQTASRLEESSLADLRQAQSISMVGNGSQARRDQEPLAVWLARCRSSLRVNPVYRTEWRGDTLSLELQWPNEVLHHECQAIEALLPRRCEVKRGDVKSLLRGTGSLDDAAVGELVDRFVFVPLAVNYARRDAAALAYFSVKK
jgi:hypothetical protein